MNILEWIKNKVKETGIIDRERLNAMYPEICLDFGYTINQASYRRQVLNVLSRIDEKTSTNSFLNEVIPNNNETYEETATSIKAQRIFTRKPQTLEEVMEMFEVDGKIWECSKWTCSNWDVTSTKAGKTATNYSVKAEFKRRTDIINYQELKEKFIKDVEEYIPTYTTPIKYKDNVSGNLLEIAVYDLHLAKLGWKPEVGENYDHKIVCDLFMQVLKDHIENNLLKGFDRILFVVGNDFFNFDTITGTTTAGTSQNNDLRWQKMYNIGVNLLVDGITYLSKYAPVDIIYVPGNHDQMTSYYAIMYLYAWFNKNDNVNIDLSPKTRKYYVWNQCLIGFTHGDKEKKRLEGLMQIEAKEEWGKTKYKEFHVGHFHSELSKEVNGLIIRNISSITAPDAWHFEQGYIGATRKSPSYLWNKDNGLINIYNAVVN